MGTAGDGLVWIDGSIRAASVYTAWTSPGDGERLRVLIHMAVLDNGGNARPTFAVVSVTSEELRARGDLPRGSAQRFAAAVRAATSPAKAPLETLRDPELWRVVVACSMAALERDAGPVNLFAPARVGVDESAGLVRRVEMVDGPCVPPRAALLSVEAHVPIEAGAIAAQEARRPDACAAWLRLAALQQEPGAALDTSVRVRITTPMCTFTRRYTTLRFPPVEAEGAVSDLFSTHDASVVVDAASPPVSVRVLVPMGFDYLVSDSESFSTPAVLALFGQWHAAAFSRTVGVPQVFAFLGTEFYPRGGGEDYFATIGFPGWPTLRVPVGVKTDGEERKRRLETHARTMGMWPALGRHAFLTTDAWQRAAAHVARSASRPVGDAISRWAPNGRTSQLVDPPDVIGPAVAARFRVPHVAGLLLSAIARAYPQLTLERGALRFSDVARDSSENRWAKIVLDGAAAEVLDTCDAAARCVGGIRTALEARIEREATAAGFAICGSDGDTFWGVFATTSPNARSVAESAAGAFAAVAAELLEESGLHPPTPVRAVCEGVYSHAVLWHPRGLWLGGRDSDVLEGFSLRSRAHERAADALREAFWRLVRVENPSAALRDMRDTCDGIITGSFPHRGDVDYWSLTEPPQNCRIPGAALDGGTTLDAERGDRRVVYVKTCEGGAASVPVELYRAPLVIPPIDCARHLKDILGEVVAAFRAFAEVRWGTETAFSYTPEDGPMFMFQ
ncbi:helicase-primase subunit [Bovine alphaherpesvirus 2]|uniref:Helicase-primase subunit n=1 Tax=Bovine alphaherpesvirus 2 TaxID=10295 RepID=A0A7T1P447_9ALPH|nr:helicase-primase subunit [Bovine alphaherpesvirus 2]